MLTDYLFAKVINDQDILLHEERIQDSCQDGLVERQELVFLLFTVAEAVLLVDDLNESLYIDIRLLRYWHIYKTDCVDNFHGILSNKFVLDENYVILHIVKV